MIVRYWQPWREIEAMRRQLDQVFDGLAQTIEPVQTPAIELQDAGDHLVLRAQLPGMEAKDLDIQVTQEAVLISGEHRHEHKAEEKGYFKSEFRYGTFRRVVPLPVAIENAQVQAEYKDGILNLTLPKVVEARNKAVKINLVESPSDDIAPDANGEVAA
ncbi:MAG: Hsp20/alpha crystallin family protein [Cyanobacteria bacterium CRU_2_1]|nr:Hsp20/alpha crystallin family protein [Cyanobacteria bacterium RU_5_0]NJR60050.1 Hsp20/alpha crystallin family protein [Cyanobacteria bacterium CRU_2_1]